MEATRTSKTITITMIAGIFAFGLLIYCAYIYLGSNSKIEHDKKQVFYDQSRPYIIKSNNTVHAMRQLPPQTIRKPVLLQDIDFCRESSNEEENNEFCTPNIQIFANEKAPVFEYEYIGTEFMNDFLQFKADITANIMEYFYNVSLTDLKLSNYYNIYTKEIIDTAVILAFGSALSCKSNDYTIEYELDKPKLADFETFLKNVIADNTFPVKIQCFIQPAIYHFRLSRLPIFALRFFNIIDSIISLEVYGSIVEAGLDFVLIGLEEISIIILFGCSLSSFPNFLGLQKLDSINLTMNKIVDLNMDNYNTKNSVFRPMFAMTEVILSYNNIEQGNVEKFFTIFPNVNSMIFEGCRLNSTIQKFKTRLDELAVK